ncbi:WXG100 family type VII secretion target, partial [Rhizomonospora bruguierae]
MSEFDGYNVHELREIANDDNDAQRMDEQAEGWRGMAWLFEAQVGRLEVAMRQLQAAWNSPAGRKFLEEVDKVKQTLSAAQEKATGNQRAWTAISQKAKTVKTEVAQIEQDYLKAWGKAQADYEAAKKKDADNFNWAWGGLGDLWDDPDPPNQNAVRAPYDTKARLAMAGADTVYVTEYRQNLWTPPPYEGPRDAKVPEHEAGGGGGNTRYTGGGGGSGDFTVPGGRPGTIPGYNPPNNTIVIPPGQQPPAFTPPDLPDLEGGLVPPVPPGGFPPAPPLIPPGAPPVGGPPIVPPITPPGTPAPNLPIPPGRGLPIPPGSKPPLLPNLPEGNQPITGGRNLPGGRPPGSPRLPGGGLDESIVGGRPGSQGPQGGPRNVPGGRSMPGGRPMPGRGGAPGEGQVPGGRPAPGGRGVTRPV